MCGAVIPEGSIVCVNCDNKNGVNRSDSTSTLAVRQTMFKLKPCPICGGIPISLVYTSNPQQYGYSHCGIETGYCETEELAELEWNEKVNQYQADKHKTSESSFGKASRDCYYEEWKKQVRERFGEPKDEDNQSAKADSGKPILSYVPKEIIYEIEKVRSFGVKKYKEPDNWKKVELERYHEALLRHTLAIWDDVGAKDKESGLLHLSHMATNIAFILELMKDKE